MSVKNFFVHFFLPQQCVRLKFVYNLAPPHPTPARADPLIPKPESWECVCVCMLHIIDVHTHMYVCVCVHIYVQSVSRVCIYVTYYICMCVCIYLYIYVLSLYLSLSLSLYYISKYKPGIGLEAAGNHVARVSRKVKQP